MNAATERSEVGTIIYSWSPPVTLEIIDPGKDFEPPEPTGDVSSPSAYLAWEIGGYGVEQVTFGGTVQTTGDVELWVWVERDTGDLVWRQVFDSIADAFRDATPGAGLTFHEARPGDSIIDGHYIGREIRVPFHRFEET